TATLEVPPLSLHDALPIFSRHDARSQRGLSVLGEPRPVPLEPPTISMPRSRLGSVGMPTPRFTEPIGSWPSVSSLVSPSRSRSKYEPPPLVPWKASSALR